MREPTLLASCGGASQSNSALRNDPVPVPPSVAGNLARSSSDTSPAVLIVAVYRWRADRKGSTWSVPFPTPAIRSVTRLPCAVVAHGRNHERAELVRPRIAIPTIPLCLDASGFSSNPSLAPPRPARRSAAVSHRRSGSPERLAPGSVELVLGVLCSILPSLRKYLRHRGVDELPVRRETPWYRRNQHRPRQCDSLSPKRAPDRSCPG